MWKEILEALCKSFAQDDPQLVSAIWDAEEGFKHWSQYFNPNDISVMEDGDKVTGHDSVVEFETPTRGDYAPEDRASSSEKGGP